MPELSKTNQARADRGKALLTYHQQELLKDAGFNYEDSDVNSLLADLFHFCAGAGIDWHECVGRAETHLQSELDNADNYLDEKEESDA